MMFLEVFGKKRNIDGEHEYRNDGNIECYGKHDRVSI